MNKKSKIINYDFNVPRYTSYPTANNFTNKINAQEYKNFLDNLPQDNSISLYLHIPFCLHLCWFCGCHTKITKKYDPIDDYLSSLKKEIKLVSSVIKEKGKVSQIHFGGGSPTILKVGDFNLLIRKIKESFHVEKNAEISIEIDPRTVNEAKIATYAISGVNRVSIGVQDFDEKVQNSINRKQPFYLTYNTIKILREYKINNINLDLMYGLPNQSLETIKKSINYSLTFNPDRIALFGYAHLPQMKKQMKLIDENILPSHNKRIKMFEVASRILIKAGYSHIGLDHFCKTNDEMNIAKENGTLRRNFQGYTTDNCDVLIGLGTSAISKLPQGFFQNTKQIQIYKDNLTKSILGTERGIILNKEDIICNHVIESLMCKMKVDVSSICQKYNVNVQQFSKEFQSLEPLEKDELISINNYEIKINDKHRQIVRYVCSFFDKFNSNQTSQYSKLG